MFEPNSAEPASGHFEVSKSAFSTYHRLAVAELAQDHGCDPTAVAVDQLGADDRPGVDEITGVTCAAAIRRNRAEASIRAEGSGADQDHR